MRTWKKIVLTIGLMSEFLLASNSYGPLAKVEFFDLKDSGEWLSFSEEKRYAEVEGTDFIALESASSESRTCVYGFRMEELEPGDNEVAMKFMCFDAGKYSLSVLSQTCEEGESCRITDPAQISVGIGNIREAEETYSGVTPQVSGGPKLPYPVTKKINFTGKVGSGSPVKSDLDKEIDSSMNRIQG